MCTRSRVGLCIVESLAASGLYCMIFSLTRNGVIIILKHLSVILSHSLNNSNNNNIENLMIKSKSKVLALPGRPECGLRLAWSFPPRSK